VHWRLPPGRKRSSSRRTRNEDYWAEEVTAVRLILKSGEQANLLAKSANTDGPVAAARIQPIRPEASKSHPRRGLAHVDVNDAITADPQAPIRRLARDEL
jgi:hypothetical protein